MQVKLTRRDRLNKDERRELNDSAKRGFLVLAENTGDGLLIEHWRRCSENRISAVTLFPEEGQSRRLVIYSQSIHAYLEHLKIVSQHCSLDAVNPHSGVISAVADASSAIAIAAQLSRVEFVPPHLYGMTDVGPGVEPTDLLNAWLLNLPIAAENWSILQLLNAGKIRAERVREGGNAQLIFRCVGRIDPLEQLIPRMDRARVGSILALFVEDKTSLGLAEGPNGPALKWRPTDQDRRDS